MLIKTISAFVRGVEAMPITIETDVSHGMPAYQVVGKPDTVIKESKERLRLALMNSGFSYPKGRVTVNMVPAEVQKHGSHFDLAIAVGILMATGQAGLMENEAYGFIGELSLDGKIHRVNGVLPMVAAMRKEGVPAVVVPKENVREALLVPDIRVYGVQYIEEVVQHLDGNQPLRAESRITGGMVFHTKEQQQKDFGDVRGQETAKRAITIAVAGGHGLLMMGSPSTGKTMLSQRIPGIMPEMSSEEIFETTTIYSVAGLLDEKQPFVCQRPFRQPHHKITLAGLLGGGMYPRPGEISLANKGVLFLDEVGEFDYRIMDALRLPLEKKEITLVRQNHQYSYPADFLLIAASNPCPCGYLGDPVHPCKCSANEISRYQRRFSGPIMDRIDMHIHLMPVAYDELVRDSAMTSEEMKKSITLARQRQAVRYKDIAITLNQQLDEKTIERYAPLEKEAEELLPEAYERMKLNPRTLLKVRKMARTIADLDGSEQIALTHLMEALQYRERDYAR